MQKEVIGRSWKELVVVKKQEETPPFVPLKPKGEGIYKLRPLDEALRKRALGGEFSKAKRPDLTDKQKTNTPAMHSYDVAKSFKALGRPLTNKK